MKGKIFTRDGIKDGHAFIRGIVAWRAMVALDDDDRTKFRLGTDAPHYLQYLLIDEVERIAVACDAGGVFGALSDRFAVRAEDERRMGDG